MDWTPYVPALFGFAGVFLGGAMNGLTNYRMQDSKHKHEQRMEGMRFQREKLEDLFLLASQLKIGMLVLLEELADSVDSPRREECLDSAIEILFKDVDFDRFHMLAGLYFEDARAEFKNLTICSDEVIHCVIEETKGRGNGSKVLDKSAIELMRKRFVSLAEAYLNALSEAAKRI